MNSNIQILGSHATLNAEEEQKFEELNAKKNYKFPTHGGTMEHSL